MGAFPALALPAPEAVYTAQIGVDGCCTHSPLSEGCNAGFCALDAIQCADEGSERVLMPVKGFWGDVLQVFAFLDEVSRQAVRLALIRLGENS